MQVEKKPFLRSLHYFRAFAIINVMMVHIWRVPETSNPLVFDLVTKAREVLFHGSSIFFLFISGYLFSYLSVRFKVVTYYRNKLGSVVAPYLLITFLLSAKSAIPILLSRQFDLRVFLSDLLGDIIRGTAQYQYWYIPFIIPLIAISPLMRKIPAKVHLPVSIVAFMLPLLGTRTATLLTFGQYLYFLPVYLLGMFSAENREAVALWTKRLRPVLLALMAGSFVILLVCEARVGWFNLFESAQFLNKISITFLVLQWLSSFEDRKFPLIDSLAKYSFALYFTHFLFDDLMFSSFFSPLLGAFSFLSRPIFLIPVSLAYVVLRIAFCLLLCAMAKRFLGRYSRFFIGV